MKKFVNECVFRNCQISMLKIFNNKKTRIVVKDMEKFTLKRVFFSQMH